MQQSTMFNVYCASEVFNGQIISELVAKQKLIKRKIYFIPTISLYQIKYMFSLLNTLNNEHALTKLKKSCI